MATGRAFSVLNSKTIVYDIGNLPDHVVLARLQIILLGMLVGIFLFNAAVTR